MLTKDKCVDKKKVDIHTHGRHKSEHKKTTFYLGQSRIIMVERCSRYNSRLLMGGENCSKGEIIYSVITLRCYVLLSRTSYLTPSNSIKLGTTEMDFKSSQLNGSPNIF